MVVVEEDSRLIGGGVGVGRAAGPAEEDAVRRVDGDWDVRAGGVGAEAVDSGGGGVSGKKEELAVHEPPVEVGLRLAIGLRPAARRLERGEVVRRAHFRRVKGDDGPVIAPPTLLRTDIREAVHEAEAVVAVRTTRQGAREAADVRIAGRVAVTTRRVTAHKGDFAVLLQLAEEAADTVGAMGARDRVTVEDEGTATMPACHIADEASDAVGGG